MHFCSGLPIILVGCKKDLRRDQRVVDGLRATSQKPVSPEEVRVVFSFTPYHFNMITSFSHSDTHLLTAFLRPTGYGSCPKDRCETLSGMLC
jgi:hypothetical protein